MFEDEGHLYLLMEWVSEEFVFPSFHLFHHCNIFSVKIEGGELWHHLHTHPGGHFTNEGSVFYAAEVRLFLS